MELALWLNKVNNKWPAIILAVRRIVKVIGRIIFLIVSINTMNGISKMGVPCGIIWENIKLVLFFHPNNINPSHIDIEILIEKIICLDLVKIYGYSLIILLIKIIKKIEINKILFI